MIPKFRAWDKRFSEFVEDFFVSEDGKIYKNTKDTSYGFAISRETSDKVILMQSTGLKDKNGKEIFEGDVVTFEDEIRCGDDLDIFLNIGVVEYGQGMFYISNRQSVCADDLLDGEMWDVEVIGNIYENPELLPK
jgi:hypothetical protein